MVPLGIPIRALDFWHFKHETQECAFQAVDCIVRKWDLRWGLQPRATEVVPKPLQTRGIGHRRKWPNKLRILIHARKQEARGHTEMPDLLGRNGIEDPKPSSNPGRAAVLQESLSDQTEGLALVRCLIV